MTEIPWTVERSRAFRNGRHSAGDLHKDPLMKAICMTLIDRRKPK